MKGCPLISSVSHLVNRNPSVFFLPVFSLSVHLSNLSSLSHTQSLSMFDRYLSSFFPLAVLCVCVCAIFLLFLSALTFLSQSISLFLSPFTVLSRLLYIQSLSSFSTLSLFSPSVQSLSPLTVFFLSLSNLSLLSLPSNCFFSACPISLFSLYPLTVLCISLSNISLFSLLPLTFLSLLSLLSFSFSLSLSLSLSL